MLCYCGLILKDNENYLIDNCINLNYFYELYKNISIDEITYNKFCNLEEVKKILENNLYGLYDSLFNDFINNKFIENYDFNKIIHLNLLFYLGFNNKKNMNKSIKYNNSIKIHDLNENFEKKLLIRTGVIELRVINSLK